jgi:hypothetical protein
MAVEGTLELFRLPEILQLISQQQKTGILTVQGQNDIVAISFLTGRIVAADALNQTMEEGLARVLVSEGVLGPQDLSRAHAEHLDAGGRLLDLLVERRYVTRSRLLDALRLQTFRLVEQLLGWDQGDFKFYSGDEVSYEEGLTPISVEELLLRAAQDEMDQEESRAAARAHAAPAAPATPPRPAAPPPPLAAVVARAAEPAQRRVERPAEQRPRLVPADGSPPAGGAGVSALPSLPPLQTVPTPQAGPGVFRKMKVEATLPLADRRAARLLALAVAVLLAASVVLRSDRLVLPMPWQSAQRQDLAQTQRAALFAKIDRAAKTYFLLEGHFPDVLAGLEEAGLLAEGDLRDPQGLSFAYQGSGDGYSLQPLDGGKPVPEAEAVEAITGNFLLDPAFITLTPDSQVPLVLLD